MVAIGLQGLGRLAEAATMAADAAKLAATDPDLLYVQVLAQRALIAALAESRLLDDAWRECLVLETLISDDIDEDTAGKGYWVIGNVAFLADRVADGGGRYHDLAAERLSPSKDVDLWARFNRASAEMRLQAKLGDAATLRCIERAELATDIVGGSERDHLEMSLVRAHWNYLAGDMQEAWRSLNPFARVPPFWLPRRPPKPIFFSDGLCWRPSGMKQAWLLSKKQQSSSTKRPCPSAAQPFASIFGKASGAGRTGSEHV